MALTEKQKREAPLCRPQYRKKQLLTAEQLQQEQHFHAVNLRRVLHGLAGEGVIYGYAICIEAGIEAGKEGCSEEIEIGCGLALDRYGRQLYWNGNSLSMAQFVEFPDQVGEYI
ncbi:MAG: hypothetical protein WA970_13870, partial [Gammaproteobacteria bacterium]